MKFASNREDRERLEHEIHSSEYKRLLRALQRDCPFLRRFVTWMDVVAFMWAGTSTDPRKDVILRSIIQAHAKDQDARWHTVILVMFLPGLECLHAKKNRWDPDPEELWSNILWTAIEVLTRIDLNRRPDRLVQKIYNETFHRLYEKYLAIWARSGRETPVDRDELVNLADNEEAKAHAGKFDCINFFTLGFQEEKENEISQLRGHKEAGRISEDAFLQLVATKVYADSTADYATKEGLSYDAARKRRQRAEAAIRAFSEGKQ
ncbi:MAG: hypothetical protein IH577_01860 [Deltaproteobacteria bacterium]|nr:hypothetical protein [Deltaproteobacteria bacterium]